MIVNFDFPFYLTSAVVFTGIVTLMDKVWLRKRRALSGAEPSKLVEYSLSFFPALVTVWAVRSFLVQPYRVPTGSLEPTVMPGDFIAVNQFAYGLKSPVVHKTIIGVGKPQRGQIALFFYPENTAIRYVKRVIGLPGDHVVYKDKTLTINGKEMPKKLVGTAISEEPGQLPMPVWHHIENLDGVEHAVYTHKEGGLTATVDVVVPEGHYFMMGDNRDDSDDSRRWGFVPEENFIGRAFGVWMSWDVNRSSVRWSRIGVGIH